MKLFRNLFVVALSAALVLGLAACSPQVKPAATVNGEPITEAAVTQSIEAMRAQSEDYATPEGWANALAESGLTPESLREMIIDSKVQEFVITQEAKTKGITADTAAIDQDLAETKEAVSTSDAEWLTALQEAGYASEQEYKDSLIINSLSEQLYESYEFTPTDEQLQEYVIANVADFVANNSETEDEELYLEEDEEASADDEEATEEDEGEFEIDLTEDEEADEAEEAEDVEAEDADAADAEDEAAEDDEEYLDFEPVDLKGYTVPADGVIVYADIPDTIIEALKEQYIEEEKTTQFEDSLDALIGAAAVVINPMPSDVSYNVDMSLATVTAEDDSEDEDVIELEADTDEESAAGTDEADSGAAGSEEPAEDAEAS
jgi:foldase protein PrsA